MTRRSFVGLAGMGGALAAGMLGACSAEESQDAAAVPAEEVETGPVVRCTVNGLRNPMTVPAEAPLFGWALGGDVAGLAQASYQLTVRDAKGDVAWDSGSVASDACQNVAYEGSELSPKSRYTWAVSVTDADGNVLESEEQSFSTGLPDGTYASWQGAQWVGADELYFDAAVANYFSLDATLEIPEGGTRAGIVLGADDFRLRNPAMNIWGSEATSAFTYEVDVTDAKKPKLNIYVAGMPTFEGQNGGDETKPAYVVDIPGEALAEKGAHGPIQVNVNTLTNINQVTCSVNGVVVDENRQINPLGNTHDYNSFPNVASIGFAVPAGETATFTDVALHYPGSYEEKYEVGDYFSVEAGATYAIFEGLDGVTVEGGVITVDGGDGGTLAFADPSWGSVPMLRTEFEAKGGVTRATLYAAAQGVYELYVNGEPVSDGWFSPGSEEYATFMPYRAYDVTGLVVDGANALGAQLGEGWWSGYQSYTVNNWGYYGAKLALMALLEVEYEDGSTQAVVTDTGSWKVSTHGPVRAASNFHGERYDATIAAAYDGWATAGFDASGWEEPVELEPRQNGFSFVPRLDEEGHVVGELSAEALGEAKAGTGSYIYDMGENVMGVPRITIPAGYADEGDLVTVRYAEVLYPDLPEYQEAGTVGLMMVENLRGAMDVDFYVATGGEQVFEPRLTYRGFRYMEVTGLKKELPAENVKLEKLSSIDVTSAYEGSNELATRLFKNVQNSQTSNFLSLPTDCPQRNERLGWTGDAQVFSGAAAYNADVYNFYRNWLRALRADQQGDGSLPVFAPTFAPVPDSMPYGFEGTSWDAALMVIPWNMYQMTGDDAIIRDNIDAIERYLAYTERFPLIIPDGEDDLEKGTEVPELTGKVGFLADWLSIELTDCNLINECVYVYLLGISAQMAEIVGKGDLAKKWSAMHEAAKAKWNELYFDAKGGKTCAPRGKVFDVVTYSGYMFTEGGIQDTEASYATPLAYGVFSDENAEAAAKGLAEAVDRAGYTVTSGFSGTPFLVPMLTKYGYVEEAYKLFEQENYASWLYPVVNGATSVWERWNSFTVEGGFNGNNSMNSFDHFSLGAISQWMMEYHLGIAHDEPGWQRFVLQPVPGGTFTSASGSFDSRYGTIESGWEADGGKLKKYRCVVPANTSATLYLPVTEAQAQAAELPEGASYAGMDVRNSLDCATFELVPGTYELAF